MVSDFYTVLNTVKKVLALDFACEESCFDNEGVFIHEAREARGRWRLPFRKKSLSLATMGRGVVICCSADRLRWTKTNLSQLTRNDLFATPATARMETYVRRDGQYMAGPDLKYVCAPDIFRPYTCDQEIQLNLVDGTRELELYNDKRFPNTIGYSNNPRRVAAFATCNGNIASVAAACADSDIMWQIGVDTIPEYRNKGIGKAVVSAITQYILQRGIVPYFSTNTSNLGSRRIATALGYRSAWVEMYSREPVSKK